MLICALAAVTTLYSQVQPNVVYSSQKSPVHLDIQPSREIAGGTIINADYSSSSSSSITVPVKGAFEYACRIVEECIPTTCPLKLKVEFSNAMPENALAVVYSKQAEGMFGRYGDNTFDKVYAKRYEQIYNTTGFSDEAEGLDFYLDSEDATILFSSKANFNYSIDTEDLKSDEYDFVTVAEQAIIKAVGFYISAHLSDNNLNVSYPANQYSLVVLNDEGFKNYQWATSGNAYLQKDKWLLESQPPYRPGITLNYLDESNGDDTAIMQYGISPGSYIRNIGTFMKTFFSLCNWDRDILVGIGGSLGVGCAMSNDVIGYVGMKGKNKASDAKHVKASDNIGLGAYLESVRETGEEGNYVLLNDGSWRKYKELCELNDTNSYARTVDGCLRLKNISKTYGPNGSYSNWFIQYQLYSYLPRKAEAQMIGYKISTDDQMTTIARRNVPRVEDNETYIDVTIGMKNLEGTDYVIVEQTDADYPIPYTYIIDKPKTGSFVAYMNKKYASTFKLTYVNENGQTVADPFTVKVVDVPSQVGDVVLKLNGNMIAYKVNDHGQQIKYHYFIRNIDSGVGSKQGYITQLEGNINISSLPVGSYAIEVYGYVPSMIRVAQMVWFNKK